MTMNIKQVAQHRGISVEQVKLLKELRGLTREGIEKLPEKSLRKAMRRLDYPDQPRARLAYRLQQARIDKGLVPRQPLIAALRELDSLRLRARRTRVAGVPTGNMGQPAGPVVPAAAGLATERWLELGPDNIGGRTRSILIHPVNHAIMWAASVGGGIWRSDDGGHQWQPADDFMANLAVTSLAMQPNDPNLIYAGTGEGFGNVDGLRGGGIFRTTDSINWSQIPSTAASGWESVNRLAISADGAVLLAATNGGLRRSVDAARSVWTVVLPEHIADVKFHPTDPLQAVAGSIDGGMSWVTKDGAATWTASTHAGSWGRRVELCYALANPTIVYASVDVGNGEIWRSNNGGRSFTRRQTKNPDGDRASYLGDQGWYDNVIWAGDPTNADLVIAGGIDLWRSTDGGDTLIDISTWWDPRSAHADQHMIASHPGYNGISNRTVYFGNDGGIYRADDVTTVGNDPTEPRIAGWISLSKSYNVTQFYGAAGNLNSGVIIAGAQDNGTLAYHPAGGALSWQQIFGGDGGYCCSDPNDPQVFYGEYVYLNIHRNLDGATTDDTTGDRYITGQYWNQTNGTWSWKQQPFQIPDAFNQRALFIAPFMLDPNDSSRMLAGGQSLWRTNNVRAPNTPVSGPSWTRIKTPSNGMISAIAVATGNSDHIWTGYDSGEIWLSQNGTAANPSWSRIDGQGQNPLLTGRFCHQILVSPHDLNTVIAVFGGYVAGNIWLTEDAGLNWSNIGGSLPKAPIRAVAIHPSSSNWIYIGTEVGVLASEDRGLTWSAASDGPANVSVDDLFWMGEKLICVTHGRGLFSIELAAAIA